MRSSTALFVWDGDVLAQELTHDATITYLQEPDSFVPMAQILSNLGHKLNSFFSLKTLQLGFYTESSIAVPACDQTSKLLPVKNWLIGKEAGSHNSALLKINAASSEEAFQISSSGPTSDVNNPASSDRIAYYFCDHLGTPVELADEAGRLRWAARMGAWGRLHVIANPPESGDIADEGSQPIRFQGQYEDRETGLFYNRYRYYDPDTARYLTQDRLGLLSGLNFYAYASNPTSWIDPRGLSRTKRGCDPCCGRDPAAEASATQGVSTAYPNNPYTGKDSYINAVLSEGTILYSLSPGRPPGFAVTNHTVIKAEGSAKKYHDLTQVQSDNLPPGYSMRTDVTVYRVTADICVGKSIAKANVQFGNGGATQYYVSPTDLGKLKAGISRKI